MIAENEDGSVNYSYTLIGQTYWLHHNCGYRRSITHTYPVIVELVILVPESAVCEFDLSPFAVSALLKIFPSRHIQCSRDSLVARGNWCRLRGRTRWCLECQRKWQCAGYSSPGWGIPVCSPSRHSLSAPQRNDIRRHKETGFHCRSSSTTRRETPQQHR